MKTILFLKGVFVAAIIFIAVQTASFAQIIPPEEFVAVEKEPSVDLQQLSKRLVYPKLAIRDRIEGKVVVKVLIDSNGIAQEAVVDYSDNKIFDTEAINAVMGSTFTPAVAEGKPIACWVSIPVQFKLYDRSKKSDINTNTTEPKKETPVTEPK